MSKLQALWPPTQSKGGTWARKMAGQCDEILATCKEIQSTLRDSSSIRAPRVQEVLGATAALQLFGAAAQHTRCQATPVLLAAALVREHCDVFVTRPPGPWDLAVSLRRCRVYNLIVPIPDPPQQPIGSLWSRGRFLYNTCMRVLFR